MKRNASAWAFCLLSSVQAALVYANVSLASSDVDLEWHWGGVTPGPQSQNTARANTCGYPRLDEDAWPFGQTAAISPDNSLPYACGSCIEIASNTSQFDSFVVQITDLCRDCNTDTISLPLTANASLAKLMQQGTLDILYRQVTCDPPGNMKLKLEETPAGALIVHPLEVAGSGRISAVDVRRSGNTLGCVDREESVSKLQSGDGGWKGMSFVATGMFKVYSPPEAPLDFRITPHAGQALIALNVSGTMGASNKTFPTLIQASRAGWLHGPGISNSSAAVLFGSPSNLPTLGQANGPLEGLPPPAVIPEQAPEAAAGAAPPQPSPEAIKRSVHAAQVAQTLLQRQHISLEEALSLQLPLCVPVSIGQVRQCVPVLYDSGAPAPQPVANPPWEAPGPAVEEPEAPYKSPHAEPTEAGALEAPAGTPGATQVQAPALFVEDLLSQHLPSSHSTAFLQRPLQTPPPANSVISALPITFTTSSLPPGAPSTGQSSAPVPASDAVDFKGDDQPESGAARPEAPRPAAPTPPAPVPAGSLIDSLPIVAAPLESLASARRGTLPPRAGGQGGGSLSADIALGTLGPLQSSLVGGPGASLASSPRGRGSQPVVGAAQSPGQMTQRPSAHESQPGASGAGTPGFAPSSSLGAPPPAGALLSGLSGLIPNQRGSATQSG